MWNKHWDQEKKKKATYPEEKLNFIIPIYYLPT